MQPHGHPPHGHPPHGAAPLAPVHHVGPLAATVQCRFCGSAGPHLTISKVSPVGWIVFGVLVFVFLPLCWIGVLMKSRGLQCGSCRHWIMPPS